MSRELKQGQLIQVRHERNSLLIENAELRPLKTELAQLRSSLADLFFKASEKVIDESPPSRLP